MRARASPFSSAGSDLAGPSVDSRRPAVKRAEQPRAEEPGDPKHLGQVPSAELFWHPDNVLPRRRVRVNSDEPVKFRCLGCPRAGCGMRHTFDRAPRQLKKLDGKIVRLLEHGFEMWLVTGQPVKISERDVPDGTVCIDGFNNRVQHP